jgi:hypothetical protein
MVGARQDRIFGALVAELVSALEVADDLARMRPLGTRSQPVSDDFRARQAKGPTFSLDVFALGRFVTCRWVGRSATFSRAGYAVSPGLEPEALRDLSRCRWRPQAHPAFSASYEEATAMSANRGPSTEWHWVCYDG